VSEQLGIAEHFDKWRTVATSGNGNPASVKVAQKPDKKPKGVRR
jgi:hypothetical protein